MRYVILIFLLVLAGCGNSSFLSLTSQKIEHTYHQIGEISEDDNAKYIINQVTEPDMKGNEGKKWVVLNIDFYDNLPDDADDEPLCYLVHEDKKYRGFTQSLVIPQDGKINTQVLFEIPAEPADYEFFCDLNFAGVDPNMNDESRSIVKLRL